MPPSIPRFHIALLEPEIAPNTGNVGRLCLGLGAHLHLIHPLGFQTDEKAVRRAGLDYWREVMLTEHPNWRSFQDWAGDRRILAFSKKADLPYTRAGYQAGDVLLFGKETVGLPGEVQDRYPGYKIPMPGPTRSLNLSNAVAVVAYRALQDIEPGLFE